MKFDIMTGGMPLPKMQDLARDASKAGISGLVITEGGVPVAAVGCCANAIGASTAVPSEPVMPLITARLDAPVRTRTPRRLRL